MRIIDSKSLKVLLKSRDRRGLDKLVAITKGTQNGGLEAQKTHFNSALELGQFRADWPAKQSAHKAGVKFRN